MTNTYDLKEAAIFLRMSPSALRVKVKQGLVKASKPGKRWVFLESDLLEYLRAGQVVVRKNASLAVRTVKCPSTNVGESIGFGLRLPAENDYASLLKLPADEKRRNITTS